MTFKVPKVVLGSQPMLGESYQGEERNRLYRLRFSNVESTVRLLREARRLGLDTISIMAAPGNSLFWRLLEALRLLSGEGLEFLVAPCVSIPLTLEGKPVDDYRRWLTYYTYEASLVGESRLRRKYLEDPILATRPGWTKKFADLLKTGKPYKRGDFQKLGIDFERLEERIAVFEGFRLGFANLGSESDFLAISNRVDLLGEAVDRLRGMGFENVLLSLHHAGSAMPILRDGGLRVDGYVTPVNPMGALMLPSMELALKTIGKMLDRVVAIKPLAGGRVAPEEAFRFLARIGVGSCMIGVASVDELRSDLNAIRRFLGGAW